MRYLFCFYIFTFLPLFTNSFNPIQKPGLPVKLKTQRSVEKTARDMPGAIEPLGFWDPLHLSDNSDMRIMNYIREAELQHGRIAMLSMVIMPTLDIFDKSDLAINAYKTHPDIFFSKEALSTIVLTEISRLLVQYDNPMTSMFRLKNTTYPGNLFQLDMNDVDNNIIDKELSNGRLAMIGALGYIAQELVTGTKIFH